MTGPNKTTEKTAGTQAATAGLAAVLPLEALALARLLLQPLRVEILQLLAEPLSCGELARALGCTSQRVHYHVRALETAGLVRRVAERKVRALTEGIYQAAARHFWPGPALLHSLGGNAAVQDALSRNYLLSLAAELGNDAARLALSGEAEQQNAPTLSLSASVNLPGMHRRNAFLKELQHTLRLLAEKYGVSDEEPGAEPYKLVLACYPAEAGGERDEEDVCD